LLGAFHAQHSLRLAAIGGKDSMSGSFNELDVPPTLVSFALAPGKASLALSPEFKQAGSTVSLVTIPRDATTSPDFEVLKQTAEALHQLNTAKANSSPSTTSAARPRRRPRQMSFGNHIGFNWSAEFIPQHLYQERCFTFLIEHTEELPSSLNAQAIGPPPPNPPSSSTAKPIP
jgi:phosphoribosylformylglycinamidine synthase